MARARIKLALPKGRLQADTAAFLGRKGWALDGYGDSSRRYRFSSVRFPYLQVKVFQEKDIPIQVGIGNYDIGICGLDWIEEHRVKYPASALVPVRHLGYGRSDVMAAVSASGVPDLTGGTVRLASEYPNLAERLALELRLRRFCVFPLWGGAEAYPPENADIVLISRTGAQGPPVGLVSCGPVLSGGACLVANRDSLEAKDMGELLGAVGGGAAPKYRTSESGTAESVLVRFKLLAMKKAAREAKAGDGSDLRFGLPDGHQQPPTSDFMRRAGIGIEGYSTGDRRPKVALDGWTCKVIRPQDMPLQVANGAFAVGVTGQDWLREHHCQFPDSPVQEMLTLGFGRVRVVAVVKEEVPVSSAADLRQWMKRRKAPLRIASEYVNIADEYARESHLAPYRIIPTWGATEAFLPEDADMLIENTQTGKTLAEHRLKIIDTLFESSACLVANPLVAGRREFKGKIAALVEAWRRGLSQEAG